MRALSQAAPVGSEPTWPPQPFRIEVHPDRDRAIVVPCGELDIATTPELAAEIDGLVERGFAAIVIDLRATSFIDSSGVHLLVRETARHDVRATVIDGPPPVSRILDLAGVRSVLSFEVTV